MKCVTLACCGLMALTAVCADNKVADDKTYDEVYFRGQLLKQSTASSSKVGGFVLKPGNGRLSFLHCKTKVSEETLTFIAKQYARQFKFPCNVAKCETFDVLSATKIMKDAGVTVGVFIVDDEKLPMSLVALEQRWAMVNVHGFMDGVSDDVVRTRVRRATSRAIKALFSGVEVMKGAHAVSKASDLERLRADPIDGQTLIYMVHGFPSYGLVAPKIETYKRACIEGWASAPTNAAQKAVWDEVHALPTKPLTIEPESKRGKK